ncbi:hypothetical protein N6H14_08405 [Paenibacillus sp. CC-CFT747]|nr:hypothetical protein N6H14_08405 [Paenibacillus sp. CC-CFT747]
MGITSAGYESQADLNLAIPVSAVEDLLKKPAEPLTLAALSERYPDPDRIPEEKVEAMAVFLQKKFGEVRAYQGKHDFDFTVMVFPFGEEFGTDFMISLVTETLEEGGRLMALDQQDPDLLPGLLQAVSKEAHKEFGFSYTVASFIRVESDVFPKGYPDGSVGKQDDGTYLVVHGVCMGIFDYTNGKARIVRKTGDKEISYPVPLE